MILLRSTLRKCHCAAKYGLGIGPREGYFWGRIWISGRSSNFNSVGFIVSGILLFLCYDILAWNCLFTWLYPPRLRRMNWKWWNDALFWWFKKTKKCVYSPPFCARLAESAKSLQPTAACKISSQLFPFCQSYLWKSVFVHIYIVIITSTVEVSRLVLLDHYCVICNVKKNKKSS